jgi:hypothetical protein
VRPTSIDRDLKRAVTSRREGSMGSASDFSGEWIVPESDAIDRTTAVGGPEGLDGALEWKAIRRRLDRIEPSYKT